MALQQKIDQDLKEAMISKDELRTSTLRFLKSAVKYSAIEKKADSLSDNDIFQIINKQIKQRRESIDQFTQANRQDLAQKEIAEAKILETYLPRQLSDQELQELVAAEVKTGGATSKKDFGRVMKAVTEKVAGRADSKKISEFLGKILV